VIVKARLAFIFRLYFSEQVHNLGTFFANEYPADLGTTNMWGNPQLRNSTKWPLLGWWQVNKYVRSVLQSMINFFSTTAQR
jgi:hypothetical protein